MTGWNAGTVVRRRKNGYRIHRRTRAEPSVTPESVNGAGAGRFDSGARIAEYSPGQHRDRRGRWSAQFGRADAEWGSTQRPLAKAAVAKWQSTFADCREMQENPDSVLSQEFAFAVDRSPRVQGTVYRGTGEFTIEGGDRNVGRLDAAGAKKVWEQRMASRERVEINVPVSTTPDIDAAKDFGNVIFEISGGEARDISALSAVPSFKEAVLKPGTFGIVGVRDGWQLPGDKETTIVTLVAVPAGL